MVSILTKQQDGNTSIKDLDELAPWSNTAKITNNLDDTCQTADLSGSDNLFDDKMMSCNSSFSDLAKEHSDKMIDHSFLDFEASFNASHESLDWDENEAFPKSRSASTSATPSTTGSTVDLSDFVVLSAFQAIEKEQQHEAEEESEEESEHDSSEEESSDEEEEFPLVDFDESIANHFEDDVGSEQVVTPPRRDTRTNARRQRRRRSTSLVNRQEEQEQGEALDFEKDVDGEQVLAPPLRDTRTQRRRRRSTSVQNRLGQQQQQHEEEEEAAAVALFCQQLANRGIDNSANGGKRQSRRGRQSLKQQIPSPLLHRANSDRCSSRQQQARRSISRNRDSNRPPTTRGSSHRGSFRDRSVSRDRSTASAPNALEITLDRPLLGKVGHGDSEEEEEDPLPNLFAAPATTNTSSSNPQPQQPQPKKYKAPLRRCRTTSRERTRGPRNSRLSTKLARAKSSRDALATDDHSRASSSAGGGCSSKGTGAAVMMGNSSNGNKRESRRRRSSHHERTPATPKPRTRRSVRATKSGNCGKRLMGETSGRRMLDASARSNPERSSLEDRLAGIDASARSNPETTTTIRRTRTTPVEPRPTSKPLSDVRPSKPRRKSSRAVGNNNSRPAVVPSLSSFLD